MPINVMTLPLYGTYRQRHLTYRWYIQSEKSNLCLHYGKRKACVYTVYPSLFKLSAQEGVADSGRTIHSSRIEACLYVYVCKERARSRKASYLES